MEEMVQTLNEFDRRSVYMFAGSSLCSYWSLLAAVLNIVFSMLDFNQEWSRVWAETGGEFPDRDEKISGLNS